MTEGGPVLSVILASTAPLPQAPIALGPLLRAAHPRPVQVLLAHTGADDAPPAWAPAWPGLAFLRLPPGTGLPALLGAALERARGDILGILDARCAVDAGWVSAVLAAHETRDPVIGGAVEPDAVDGATAWAAYFSDYGRFMRPFARGTAVHVPGVNVTFKRSALAEGREYVEGEFWKSYWCRRLQAAGIELIVDPAIVVGYRRTVSPGAFLAERFHHGRCFAGMRLRELSTVRRLVYVAGTPALPFLFCARILGAVLPKRRHRAALGRALPAIVLGTVAWAVGELCGYLAGAGQSCRHVR